MKEIQSDELRDISEKITEILKDDIKLPEVKDSQAAQTALIKTETVTVSVPPVPPQGGSGASPVPPAIITLAITDTTGTSTATITTINENGSEETKDYVCEINDDYTITLTDTGGSEQPIKLDYTINEKDHTLTLSNLDEIPIISESGYNNSSEPSKEVVAVEGGKIMLDDDMADVPGSDLSLLAMTLILAKAEKEKGKSTEGTLDEYLNTWNHKSLDTGKGLEPDEIIIVAVVNTMIENGDDTSALTDMVKDLLEVE
jgi:hypothetical protein